MKSGFLSDLAHLMVACRFWKEAKRNQSLWLYKIFFHCYHWLTEKSYSSTSYKLNQVLNQNHVLVMCSEAQEHTGRWESNGRTRGLGPLPAKAAILPSKWTHLRAVNKKHSEGSTPLHCSVGLKKTSRQISLASPEKARQVKQHMGLLGHNNETKLLNVSFLKSQQGIPAYLQKLI